MYYLWLNVLPLFYLKMVINLHCFFSSLCFQKDTMLSPGHLHHMIPITSSALVTSLASQSLASIAALNYDLSLVISSVTIVDIGAQLKSMGDTLDTARGRHLARLKSRMLLTWCIRALRVMYEAVA